MPRCGVGEILGRAGNVVSSEDRADVLPPAHLDTEPDGRGRSWVEVDHTDVEPVAGQRAGESDSCGGLADPAWP
jgi:hypothetical protein